MSLCIAPCDLELPRGSYRFVVGNGDRERESEQVVEVDEGTTVRGRYEDRSGLRALGWTLYVLGMTGGPLLALWPIVDDAGAPSLEAHYDEPEELALLSAGVGSFVLVGGVVAFALVWLEDVADVEVVPGGLRF